MQRSGFGNCVEFDENKKFVSGGILDRNPLGMNIFSLISIRPEGLKPPLNLCHFCELIPIPKVFLPGCMIRRKVNLSRGIMDIFERGGYS